MLFDFPKVTKLVNDKDMSNLDHLISKVNYFVALLCWRRFCIVLQKFTKFIASRNSVAIAVVAITAVAVVDIY